MATLKTLFPTSQLAAGKVKKGNPPPPLGNRVTTIAIWAPGYLKRL